jgi:hypothetical protein
MRISRLVAVCVALGGTVAMSNGALAQDSTKGVHIGLTYGTGGKPAVVVLPILGVGGDTARAIISRDLDYGDRATVIANANAPQTADVNYPLFKQLGAAAVVQAFLAPTALHVIVHDVGARKIYQTRDFPVPPTVGSPEWRLAIHAASDQVEQWVTAMDRCGSSIAMAGGLTR